jgi:hypothetical protein
MTDAELAIIDRLDKIIALLEKQPTPIVYNVTNAPPTFPPLGRVRGGVL